MTLTKNLSLIFKAAPPSVPVAGTHLAVEDRPIDLSGNAPLPANHVLLHHLYVSIDPYMRGRMNVTETESYVPPFVIDEPLDGGGIARVLQSSSPRFQVGDIVTGHFPIQQYSIQPVEDHESDIKGSATFGSVEKLYNPQSFTDYAVFLGPLGMPGLTAYSSLYDIGLPQSGQTIFISSAAGAVGQIVGVLAKEEGMVVIGSVGSDAKLKYIVDELGFDTGFNYRSEEPLLALKRLAPNGIDIYFDNVGGEQLDAALECMNDFGRIVACGMISDYNEPPEKWRGASKILHVVSKRLSMRGFIVDDANMGPRYATKHRDDVSKFLKQDALNFKIDEMGTIETADQAFVGMLQGKNFGKAVIKLNAN